MRDRAAISHHYDLSNDFYALLLDPRMAYSCAYWTSEDPSYGLADAQRDKLDLIAGKLGVQPGGRHLDVGCGWGSLSLHLAEHYGARVLGVTLSQEQKEFVDARIAERGLQDRVQIRLQDYREVPETGFDTATSIEMGEHYVRTIKAWYDTFEANWDTAVALVGAEVARVWRLYLIGGWLVFDEGRMGVDQVLAVKRRADGASGMPWVRTG